MAQQRISRSMIIGLTTGSGAAVVLALLLVWVLGLTHTDKVDMGSRTGVKYQGYTQDAFDKASDKKRVLFFYANWCPICRPADASYKAHDDQIPDDVRLFRVNILDSDTSAEDKALAKKYAVPYQHIYVVVDGQGNAVKRWSGGELAELLANVQ